MMETNLFLIPPNDLEKLILEAETPQDVLDSPFVQHSLFLGTAWEALDHLLNPKDQAHSKLVYAVQPEHPLSERRPGLGLAVRYNTVVRAAEIYQGLQDLHADDVKRGYQLAFIESQPEQLEDELKLAELKLIYVQLQDLYRDAVRHNLAVLSVTQDIIQPEKLI